MALLRFPHRSSPLLALPCGLKPAVAMRFCPVVFRLSDSSPSRLGLPYRMVLAVATMDSVLLYETEVGCAGMGHTYLTHEHFVILLQKHF